jgi:hypothetical protein
MHNPTTTSTTAAPATALTAVWPAQSTTRTAIYRSWETLAAAETPRRYLGMSAIGKPCARALWYSFRHAAAEKFEGRMLRLFNRGQREEAVFVEELRRIGCEVTDLTETGEQIAVAALAGHFRGHLDAAAVGIPEAPKTWHVCEFKTHSAKSFAKLAKDGVAVAKPEHYAQMQCYMRYTGMTRALYLAVNKDTDELHAERVRYDARAADALETRARDIITAPLPPARIADRPDHYHCRYCPAAALCHGTDPARAVPLSHITCRTCCHATPEMDTDYGRWSCALTGKTLSDADQTAACPSHLLIPALITFAEVEDAGADYISFLSKDGTRTFKHGTAADNHFTTKELTILPKDTFFDPTPPAPAPGVGLAQRSQPPASSVPLPVSGVQSPASSPPVPLATLVATTKQTLHATFTEAEPAIYTMAFSTDTQRVWRGPVASLANQYELRYSEHLTEPLKTAEHHGIQIAEFPHCAYVLVYPDDIAEIREILPF